MNSPAAERSEGSTTVQHEHTATRPYDEERPQGRARVYGGGRSGAGRAPSRRTALALGAGGGAAALLAGAAGPAASATRPAARGSRTLAARFTALEERHGARLGVWAHDTATGRTVRHRADELFPMCSVFKTFAVAAVLRDLDRDGRFLAHRVHYTEEQTTAAGYAPVTGLPENLAQGMTVGELCGAALSYSDNAAANLLLDELGGPTAVTRFCRSVGDPVTRLDRREPDLNSAEPWRRTDTTSPSAAGRDGGRLLLGGLLDRADRDRLEGWMRANTTSGETFGKALPAGWSLADKTGSGSYGTRNDVGVAYPPGRSPLVLSVFTTKPEADAASDDPLVAAAAGILFEVLG